MTLQPDPIQFSTSNLDFEKHLKAGADWLCRAHDASPDDGVSYGFYLRGKPFSPFGLGWRSSYIETSGYIVETFYDLAQRYQDPKLADRATRVATWLVEQQNPNGSFPNPQMDYGEGVVFDTGQVLFGLVRAFQETRDERFRVAGKKACDWLISHLDDDGAWRRGTYKSRVHSYNARVAWAMTDFAVQFDDQDVRDASKAALTWVHEQQLPSGLFANAQFEGTGPSFTHTIAYTIRGLLEGAMNLGDDAMIDAAIRANDCVAKATKEDGFLSGRLSEDGESTEKFVCLTGNCQQAAVGYIVAKLKGSHEAFHAADKQLGYALRHQRMQAWPKAIHGALKGSQPHWGAYASLAYPNWATKFLVEAILLREACQS